MKFVLAACLAAAASAEGLRKAETEIESNHLDLELEINGERKLTNVLGARSDALDGTRYLPSWLALT